MKAAPTARSIDPTTTAMTMVTVVILTVEGLEEEDDFSTMVETAGLEEGGGVSKMVGTFIADARNLSKLTEPNLFIVVELLYLGWQSINRM